jgi:hypothetical protein
MADLFGRLLNPMPMPPEPTSPQNDMATAGPYQTTLPLNQELQFQQWVRTNKIPFEDSPTADYDMRGFWKAMQQGKVATGLGPDGTIHFPDTFKTPYHKTFSRESIYATEKAPKWVGDKLVDRLGNVIVDETNK